MNARCDYCQDPVREDDLAVETIDTTAHLKCAFPEREDELPVIGSDVTDSPYRLDATCSLKRRWPKWASIRMDINPAAKPDIVASCEQSPFPDATFDEVFYDPPHLVGKVDGQWAKDFGSYLKPDFQRFGFWPSMAAWRAHTAKVNVEFARILKPSGLLYVKLPNGQRSHGRMIDADEFGRMADRFLLLVCDERTSVSHLARVNAQRGRGPSFVHYDVYRRR